MATKKEKEEEVSRHLTALKQFVKQGDTIYTILTNVSSNGMSRRFKVLHCVNGEIHDISYAVSKVLGYRFHDSVDYAVVVGGCGMDMSYHLVSQLSYALGFNTGSPDGSTNCYGLNRTHL